jgi:hypothetical protein
MFDNFDDYEKSIKNQAKFAFLQGCLSIFVGFRALIFFWLPMVFTATVGKEIHGKLLLAVIQGIFYPFVWIYWFLTEKVSLQVIEDSFSWFLN